MQQLNDSKHFQIRACATPYLALGLPVGSIVLLGLLTCFKGWEVHWDWIPPVLVFIGFLAAMFLWLRAFDITIKGDTLYYSTLFSRRRGLSLEEIATAKIERGSMDSHNRFRLNCLIVQPYADTGKDPIEINLVPFSPTGLKQVFEFLSAKMAP